MEIVYDEIQTCLKQNIGLVPGAKNMSHILYVEDIQKKRWKAWSL